MTRTDLQQTIKAIRQTDGTAQTPALNSKTVVLQEWLDNYNEVQARQQAALDEATPLFDEVEPTTEASEIPDHITDEVALITADDILADDYGFIRTEELLICGLPVKINCYEYGYKPFVAWDGQTFEAIEYKYIPGSLTSLKAELTELIEVFVIAPAPAPAPQTKVVTLSAPITITEIVDYINTFRSEPTAQATLSNYEGIEVEVMAVTDWTATTPLTCPIQSYQVCTLPKITRAQNNTEVVQTIETTAVNHGQVGVIVALMFIEFIKLTAVVTSFTIVFTYSLIRRTAINHALIYDSFKSTVNVARRTLQTA